MSNETHALLFDVDGAIATITINRPEQRNALNSEVREGIREALVEIERNPAVKVAILQGAGDLAFSAGADLKEMAATGLEVPPPDFVPDISAISKPIIASVNGAALGGGFYLCQQADLVIASDAATFGITEARYGRGAPWAVPLPQLIPPRIAMELLLIGQPISAQRAMQAGLVNFVVDHSMLSARTREIAHTIAANAPLSVTAGKAMVLFLLNQSLDVAARSHVEALWEPVYRSEDAQEGPRAFAAKRLPVWKGL
jgi:enoyl-CoA hydratase/carnithine racemase